MVKSEMKEKELSTDICDNCGKVRGDHKASTYHCPKGKKHRTFGHPYYDSVLTFKFKKRGKPGKTSLSL